MNRMNYGSQGVVPMPHPSVPLGYSSSFGGYGNPMNQAPTGANLSTGITPSPVAPMPGPAVVTPPVGSGLVPTASTSGAPAGVAEAGKDGKAGFFGADGFTMGDMKGLVDIIGGFGSLWSGMQTNKLAKETLAFNKSAYDRNLTNSIASYNLALEDRMRSRYTQTNGTGADADAAIARHALRK